MDGRGTPAVSGREIAAYGVNSLVAESFEVDHIRPSSRGGPDAITNYIAACQQCNRTRSNKPITDLTTRRKIAMVRKFIANESFSSYIGNVCEIDTAIRDAAYFSMVRCFEHAWHVHTSPFQVRCIDVCQRHFSGFLGVEWWSRFGRLSDDVRAIVAENLYIRGIVREYDWWQQPNGWQLMLPRYYHSPFDIAEVLADVKTIGDKPASIEPAPECYFGAVHRLSLNNQHSALNRSVRSSVNDLLRLDDFVDNGITSTALLRLWRNNCWPTHLLFDYISAVEKIQAPGQVRRHIAALQKLTSRQQAEEYLQRVE